MLAKADIIILGLHVSRVERRKGTGGTEHGQISALLATQAVQNGPPARP